jgi:hypothetical protein
MQTLTEQVYKLAPPGGLFDEAVVRTLFPGASAGALKLLVHRAVKKGEVLRLKPGFYCLSSEFRHSEPHPFVVAGVLHSPSHISLESALSHHGLIPEAVFGVSSVTTMRSRSFRTPLGEFTFRRVPARHPRSGVQLVRLDRSGWAFVAFPERALADMIYLRKNVRWKNDGLGFLTHSLRIDEESFHAFQVERLDEVREGLTNRRVGNYLGGLRKVIEK